MAQGEPCIVLHAYHKWITTRRWMDGFTLVPVMDLKRHFVTVRLHPLWHSTWNHPHPSPPSHPPTGL
jgi:hypothetical protein